MSTLKFQQSLPFVLLTVSSELAALHTSRARRHHPYNTSNTCKKCGYQLDAGFSHRRFLSHTPTSPSLLRTLCHACGGVQLVPLDKVPESLSILDSPPTTSTDHSSSTQLPVTQATSLQPKVRSRKKTGLQELLSRNRERQKDQSRCQDGSGLAAFLGGLSNSSHDRII
ncbi:hypothetical protein K443DRAFT_673933 [Laccaria amethystina LaAM-08-1]|jgi:RNase P subunit RPR2|uniref:Uncharacterized protein n=1 Tax=Laccaria amethystina LaAM-08-1 TaxID=1095629 RepID=A0A0C9X3C2_9AGAR|nr:hypothetical protein K443DRAFT_673933 [Laccaria amethystina LaAM-08-1]